MVKTKIRRIGNGSGLTIPKNVLAQHHLSEGDEIFLVPTENGLLITPFDPNFADAMKIMEGVNKRYKNALSELAK